eukprot:3382223-Rhodomonas_salina.4
MVVCWDSTSHLAVSEIPHTVVSERWVRLSEERAAVKSFRIASGSLLTLRCSALRIRGGSDPEQSGVDGQSQLYREGESDPDEDAVLEGMEKLRLRSAQQQAAQIEMQGRLAADNKMMREASKRIEEESGKIIDELDAGRSSHSEEAEPTLPKLEDLPAYAPREEDITEYQANIFRKYRAQLDQAMKDFEMEPFEQQQLDPEEEKRFLEETAEYEELRKIEREFNHTLEEAAKFWGGDMGEQLAPPVGKAEASLPPLVVDKTDPTCFETVSEAVNCSHPGQTVSIADGEHEVGDALLWLGFDHDCVPQEYPDTLHVRPGWRVNVKGQGEGAAVHGKWWLGDDTSGTFDAVSLRFCATPAHSLAWSKQVSREDAERGPPQQPEEGDEEGDEEGKPELPAEVLEGLIPDIAGVVLLEVLGSWSMEQCSVNLNGGQCIQLQDSAALDLNGCVLGGLGAANHSLEEGELSGDAVMALERHLGSELEPRAAIGVMALNRSRLSMKEGVVENVWDGGVSLNQHSSAQIVGCEFTNCGYAVGVDGAATASVQHCDVEVAPVGFLDSGAFFAGAQSTLAEMQLSHNSVRGKLWLGGRRPGKRLVERANTGDGPDEGDDGVTVEEGKMWEELDQLNAQMLELEGMLGRKKKKLLAGFADARGS